jgi:osmotically-inducible protein OsmY
MMKETVFLMALGVFILWAFSQPTTALSQSEHTDLWVKTALESVMEKDPELDLDRIGVNVDHGTIKLNGTVLTGLEKGEAEKLAMLIPGVKAIENNIRVIPDLDQDIEDDKEAKSDLLEDPLLYVRDLKVHTVYGVTTLHGIVNQANEKRLASNIAAMDPGVDRVINKIEIVHAA